MSHIDRDATVMLTVTRANKKPFTVKRFVEIVDNMMAQIHDVPKITREQQTAIAEAAKKAGITGDRRNVLVKAFTAQKSEAARR